MESILQRGELGRFHLGMEFYLDNTGEWHKITQVTHTAGRGTTINEYQYRCNDVVRIRLPERDNKPMVQRYGD